MAREVLRCHSEGKRLQLNFFLAAFEGLVNETVDLFHGIVRHGVTTNGLAATVHHKKTASPPKRAVKRIGKASIEGKILTRIGVHLTWSDVIKPLGCLIIPLHKLRSKIP